MPPGLPSERTFAAVDISWWINQALHVGGLESILSTTIGKLVALLRGEVPAFLAVAADSVGPTWRHELTENMPKEWQYKGNRDPRPDEYHAVCNQVFDVIRLHRIPILYAEGWEADDVMGAAAARARADGLITVLLTLDKDMCQVVDETTFLWDGRDRLTGPREVEANPNHPVPPRLIPDLLAIASDKGDNIPGVPDLGPARAAAVLRRYGSLEAALDAVPESVSETQIKAAERDRAAAKRSGLGIDVATTALAALRARRDVAKWLRQIQAHRSAAELSLRLTRLDSGCPIAWDLRELAIGGYDANAIRKAYMRLGFTSLAREVTTFPKSLPDWMLPDERCQLEDPLY
jgi:5'-3' exonuclease